MPKSEAKMSVTKDSADYSQWIMIAQKDIVKLQEESSDLKTPNIVELRHPRTDRGALFLFSPQNNQVQEIFSFAEKHGSWFVGNTVQSCGQLLLCTPVDPLFLVLPFLRKSTKLLPLDQLLQDSDFPGCSHLLYCEGIKYLKSIADMKGDKDLNVYKFNEEKTLRWLKIKTESLAEALQKSGINVSSGAVSANFIKSKKEVVNKESYLSYAHGMISDYLPEDLSDKLRDHLELKDPVNEMKRKFQTSPAKESPKKKQAYKKVEPTEDYSRNGTMKMNEGRNRPLQTAKEKALAKSASGTKSIMSFFKK